MSHQDDQGSFLTGFGVGLVAGAAGYFLFGTDKGKKVRQELAEEWETAKAKMEKEGVIENKAASLRQVIGDVVTKVSKELSGAKPQTEKKPKSTKKKTTKKTSSPQKFKGV